MRREEVLLVCWAVGRNLILRRVCLWMLPRLVAIFMSEKRRSLHVIDTYLLTGSTENVVRMKEIGPRIKCVMWCGIKYLTNRILFQT